MTAVAFIVRPISASAANPPLLRTLAKTKKGAFVRMLMLLMTWPSVADVLVVVASTRLPPSRERPEAATVARWRFVSRQTAAPVPVHSETNVYTSPAAVVRLAASCKISVVALCVSSAAPLWMFWYLKPKGRVGSAVTVTVPLSVWVSSIRSAGVAPVAMVPP